MASPRAVPTVALISKCSTLSQADLDAYVAPYQAFVDDWLTKQYRRPAPGSSHRRAATQVDERTRKHIAELGIKLFG